MKYESRLARINDLMKNNPIELNIIKYLKAVKNCLNDPTPENEKTLDAAIKTLPIGKQINNTHNNI